ncbi:hypothetical protein [Alkalihalobacillus sp. CinArs1]|uniref:hypothetical protein n=1 Tax=Alkalihalobacillus sp. CinArs1 TaxID=2995314 RepID=UPI0022DD485E|nr:hypothetical protein [Alkalihalobacillus sp. CinArs1]
MWLKVFLALLALLGIALMWFSVFGKRKDIENMAEGFSHGFFEFIFNLFFEFSSIKVKRVLLFTLGFVVAFIFTLGVFLS